MSRWDAFSEQEMAAIMVAFAGSAISMSVMADKDIVVRYLKNVLPMIDEISEKMDVEDDSIRSVRDMIAQFEEHRQ